MLIKTEKGKKELSPGVRTLGQKERALLLMTDGKTGTSQLYPMFGGEGKNIVAYLIADGYVELSNNPVQDRAAAIAAAPPAQQATPASLPTGAPASGPEPQAPSAASPTPIHGDPFTGLRSLATARMFLFDLSERMFAPRDKALASTLRDKLREARDPASMLEVGREIVAKVEELAGSERADNISERLARLLPAEAIANAA